MLPHHFQYVVITSVFKFIPDLPGIMVFSFMVNGSFYGFFCANVYYRKKYGYVKLSSDPEGQRQQ